MSALPATVLASAAPPSVAARLAVTDWARLAAELDERGTTTLPGLLDRETSRAIAASYGDDSKFRSRVIMAKHGCVTWGNTSKECYENTLRIIREAQAYIDKAEQTNRYRHANNDRMDR